MKPTEARKTMSSATEGGARTAAVLTVSDSVVAGTRQDGSGPAVATALEAAGYQVVAREAVPDERNHIENALVGLCEQARLVVTTGGTGVAARDVTPEATQSICDREVPGSAKGATESLAAVIDLLGHALDLLAGKTEHKSAR